MKRGQTMRRSPHFQLLSRMRKLANRFADCWLTQEATSRSLFRERSGVMVMDRKEGHPSRAHISLA